MGYRTLKACIDDLRRHGHLIDVDLPLSANLELAEVQRRVYQSGGPALLFNNVTDCQFPMVSNLFGTMERARFIFRDTFDDVQRAINVKADPSAPLKSPWAHRNLPLVGWRMLPKTTGSAAVTAQKTTVSQLPQLVSWPDDAGGFVTLPQVFSCDVTRPGLKNSNLGMYRIQLTGNEYQKDKEIGLHYQIHRGIGVQHQKAIAAGKRFPVAIFVGGNPAMSLAAVMPLPEGMSELGFAGALAGQRIRMFRGNESTMNLPIYADADFCICGYIDGQQTKPEGPFGDHLGYYSLQHEFPLMHVTAVYHRKDAIWPFTVVGRPPQEDTTFGQLIHELTGSVIPSVLPGIDSVHAVDAAGVHPLLLAIGTERYNAYRSLDRPEELLTQANAVLGQGQMSLAKYLLILNRFDLPNLDIHDCPAFFQSLLERVDWRRDLHFQTQTTIDTLDYSGQGLNAGSKVVIAAVGQPIRTLPCEIPGELNLPAGFTNAEVVAPGILAVEGPKHESRLQDSTALSTSLRQPSPSLNNLADLPSEHPINKFPLVVLCDDAKFTARSFQNFLWVTFTRSNPAVDIAGIGSETQHKHWGCRGSLIIDARLKHHHAPPLIEDPAVTKKIDAIAAGNHAIAKYL